MENEIIKGTGNSRFLRSVPDILTQYPTYADFAAALAAGTFPIDLNGKNTAGIAQQGTPLNKANLLSDATASAIDSINPPSTPDGAFSKINGLLNSAVDIDKIVDHSKSEGGVTGLDAYHSGSGTQMYNIDVFVLSEPFVNDDGYQEFPIDRVVPVKAEFGIGYSSLTNINTKFFNTFPINTIRGKYLFAEARYMSSTPSPRTKIVNDGSLDMKQFCYILTTAEESQFIINWAADNSTIIRLIIVTADNYNVPYNSLYYSYFTKQTQDFNPSPLRRYDIRTVLVQSTQSRIPNPIQRYPLALIIGPAESIGGKPASLYLPLSLFYVKTFGDACQYGNVAATTNAYFTSRVYVSPSHIIANPGSATLDTNISLLY